jgi:serine/threonine-protein kinase
LAAGLAVILGLGILYHFNYWPWEQRSGRTELADSPPLDLSRLPMTPGASIIGQDGSMLHLIPGGSFRLISSTKEETAIDVTVGSFLMDETEITNHQYVEFLNAVKENLLIKDQSVWSNDQPWLLMGEVLTGYEPIVYHGQRFRLTDTTMAANPVVRVTAAGAMAYAGFYGRRLPDLNEWFHAADARHLESNSVLASPEQPMGTGSQLRLLPSELVEKTSIPSPVGLDQPNRYGLKGLAGNVSEWVRNTNGKAKPTYYLVSGLRENQGSPSARALAREPWEAFATVGFRTALSVSSSLDSRTEIGGPNKLKTKQ